MSEDRGFRNALVSRFCKVGHTMHADGAIVIAIRMMMVMTIMVMKAMKKINLRSKSAVREGKRKTHTISLVI